MLTSLALLLALSGVEAQTALPPEKPKLICREGEQELGTHIHTGRKCKTAEEWRLDDLKRDQRPSTMRITEGQGDALTPKTIPQ
jgi:hypothetical protein